MMSVLRRRPDELRLSITIVIEPDGEGFHAFAPGLKGLHTDGTTADDALQNAVQAVRAYVESLAKHGDPLPVGPDCAFVDRLTAPFEVPAGAFLRHIELQWPSLQTSGIS